MWRDGTGQTHRLIVAGGCRSALSTPSPIRACAPLSFPWGELASFIGCFVPDERQRFSKNACLKEALRFEAIFLLSGLFWATRSQTIATSGVSGTANLWSTFAAAKRRSLPFTSSSVPSQCFC